MINKKIYMPSVTFQFDFHFTATLSNEIRLPDLFFDDTATHP